MIPNMAYFKKTKSSPLKRSIFKILDIKSDFRKQPPNIEKDIFQ
jgi:hypothetical protein